MQRRSYHQACPLARALDTVGERWTLLIVRELLLGPLRYGEIRDRLSGIGTNLLADRLKSMAKLGLVKKQAAGGGHCWSLTEAGHGLEPVILAMIRWAMKTRLPSRPGEQSRTEWDLVAMKALFVPDASGRSDGRYQLLLNDVPAVLVVSDGRLGMRTGREDQTDATIEMDSVTGWQLATGTLSRARARREQRLQIGGDTARAERLLDRFRQT